MGSRWKLTAPGMPSHSASAWCTRSSCWYGGSPGGENFVLGLPAFDLRKAARRLRSLSAQHHLAIDSDAQVEHLPIGVQQRVEILKLLYRDARLLILDEPTAVLTTHEKDQLFTVLRGLRAHGRSIVIVTHKPQE